MKNNHITEKMIPAFQKAEGGLFSNVEKADVGDAVVKMREQGIELMSWADPFYPIPSVPQHVADAVMDNLINGMGSHYTAPIGNTEFKYELAKKLKKVNGLDVEAERNILITPGSDSGLFFAMLPFIHHGDEVMILDPSYPNNFQNTEILGGTIVRVPIYEENGYQFEIEEFEKRLTEKTKMVVLTNPNNPTTTVFRREKMEQLAEFIVKNDLILVVDHAFEQPVFDGIEMVTAAALPGMWERTVSVFSFSKGYGLSGFRIGYLVAEEHIMDKLFGAAVSVLGTTSTSAQAGAIAAMRDDSYMQAYFESHDRRRKIMYEYMKDIPGVHMLMPESGFLSWINVSKLGNVDEVIAYLTEHAKVSVNSGVPYGEGGNGYIRIVHGVFRNEEELEKAAMRIRKAFLELAAQKGLC